MSANRPPVTKDSTTVEHDLRQLALVDRIIGLEGELAHLRSVTPGAEHASQRQVDLMRGSLTWKVGRAVLTPVRAVKWVSRKLTTR